MLNYIKRSILGAERPYEPHAAWVPYSDACCNLPLPRNQLPSLLLQINSQISLDSPVETAQPGHILKHTLQVGLIPETFREPLVISLHPYLFAARHPLVALFIKLHLSVCLKLFKLRCQSSVSDVSRRFPLSSYPFPGLLGVRRCQISSDPLLDLRRCRLLLNFCPRLNPFNLVIRFKCRFS
jgi:hypothetical protein